LDCVQPPGAFRTCAQRLRQLNPPVGEAGKNPDPWNPWLKGIREFAHDDCRRPPVLRSLGLLVQSSRGPPGGLRRWRLHVGSEMLFAAVQSRPDLRVLASLLFKNLR